jgi:L-amino acid N-acyltransferase
MITIRRASSDNLAAITAIYNEAILNTTATFDTQPKTIEQQKRWFENHGDKYPVTVAELDNDLVGWASLSKWSDRCAYSDTAEISLYIKAENRGQGIGRKLTDYILREGQKAGLHTLIVRIAEGNQASIHLAESVGFRHIGVMREVGRKFGRLLDVSLMQLIFDESYKPPEA